MKKISAKEYNALINEILSLQKTLEGDIGVYPTNTLVRLIDARINLANSIVKREVEVKKCQSQE